MNADKDFAKYVIEHQNAVATFRGYVLNYIGIIESIIENFIASSFIKDEKLRLVFIGELLHNKDVSFSTKINIFGSILKVKHPKEYNKSLINKINNKRDLRNKLAHYIIRSVKSNMGSDSLYFLTIKNHKQSYVSYSNDDANNLINETHDLIFEVEKYTNELMAKQTSPENE